MGTFYNDEYRYSLRHYGVPGMRWKNHKYTGSSSKNYDYDNPASSGANAFMTGAARVKPGSNSDAQRSRNNPASSGANAFMTGAARVKPGSTGNSVSPRNRSDIERSENAGVSGRQHNRNVADASARANQYAERNRRIRNVSRGNEYAQNQAQRGRVHNRVVDNAALDVRVEADRARERRNNVVRNAIATVDQSRANYYRSQAISDRTRRASESGERSRAEYYNRNQSVKNIKRSRKTR